MQPRSLARAQPYAPIQPWTQPAPRGNAGPFEKPQEFADTLRTIWRNRRLVLGCGAAAALLALAIALVLPSTYTAASRIEVGTRQEHIWSTDPQLPTTGPDAATIESARIGAQSRSVAQRVLDDLHLDRSPEFNAGIGPLPSGRWNVNAPIEEARVSAMRNRLVDRLLDHVDITILGRSNVLNIQAQSHDPDMAAAIANDWANSYLNQQRGEKLDDNNRVEGYLAGRIADLRQQLARSEQAVADYRRANGLYQGINADMSAEQLTEMNTQLIAAQAAKAEADAQLNAALGRSGGSDSVPEVVSSPLIQALKQQQAEAERNLAQLATDYGPKHPKYIEAQAQASDIRRKLNVEMGSIIAGLRNQARAADARYGALEGDLNAAKGVMGGANEKNIRLQALEQEATVNRNLLEAMLNRAKESMGREAIEQPDAKLVSSAAPPEHPSFPPRTLMVLLAGLGGALIGCALAFLRDGSDMTFRRSDQVEETLGVPVVAMVPSLKGEMPPIVHVLRKPISPFSDALRKIYIGLQLSESRQAPKTVLFSSATPAEGKSSTAASLARLLAQNGKRVLLIDCDWRSPTLDQLFKCQNKIGLASLLTEEDVRLQDTIYVDPLSGLNVLVAGKWNPSTMHALTSERMRFLLHNFAKNYDLVILDGAPVHVGSEVLALSQMVDKVLFFVRWGHTRRDTVRDALRQLADAQTDLAGVVLSRVDPQGYREFGYGQMPYGYARRVAAEAAE
ncbi:MAG: polysaccharide biosynthesis tyrosine autokinase [Alphaproteobacteria bacterium]|nr:polysaccharide biosynthesis tyrosine autokinase [Alphaproteobacteria bacterium]